MNLNFATLVLENIFSQIDSNKSLSLKNQLNEFFKLNKNLGSRERKLFSSITFNYYRNKGLIDSSNLFLEEKKLVLIILYFYVNDNIELFQTNLSSSFDENKKLKELSDKLKSKIDELHPELTESLLKYVNNIKRKVNELSDKPDTFNKEELNTLSSFLLFTFTFHS